MLLQINRQRLGNGSPVDQKIGGSVAEPAGYVEAGCRRFLRAAGGRLVGVKTTTSSSNNKTRVHVSFCRV